MYKVNKLQKTSANIDSTIMEGGKGVFSTCTLMGPQKPKLLISQRGVYILWNILAIQLIQAVILERNACAHAKKIDPKLCDAFIAINL